MKRALAIASLAVLPACLAAGDGDPWSFSLSRAVYTGSCGEGVERSYAQSPPANDHAGVVIVALLVLPFAVDVVLLPITAPHDWVCAR